jgi:signal transduction histidine kinase
MATEIQTGKSVLRPRARLIKTIGEDLISSDVVAVLELVKNSYDADASIITINFSGNVVNVQVGKHTEMVLKKEGAAVSIYDDGDGMSLEVIQSAWMEPATVMKKGVKKSPTKSRRYTGEKGIGRFASAKLSAKLKIVTKTIDDNEVVVDFDWGDFSDDSKYLDQVESKWEVRRPVEFNTKGTNLYLQNLNVDWNAEKFQALKIALSRLINPVAPVADFLIELELPKEFDNYRGLITSPDSINRPDYSIKGKVDDTGVATFTYHSKKTGSSGPFTKDLGKTLIPIRVPQSGAFDFEFRVWDRELDSLNNLAREIQSTTKNIRADLDELGGISIYRDNFRVLPYGERKNDWLRLDARRVNNPTLRISNNQIVGYISVSLDNNKDLTDQSNREGIVDSIAFTDLQDQVKSLLNELENKRYEERPRRDDPQENNSLYNNFSIAPLVDAVKKKLPHDVEFMRLVTETQNTIDTGVKKVQEVLSRYRRLSTLGQLVDSILHDGSHFLVNIDGATRLLDIELKKKLRDDTAIDAHLKTIQEQRKIMAQLFKRLAPFGGRKRGRPSSVIIEEAIKNVFEISKKDLGHLGVEVSLPETQNTVTIDEGELQMILINLLQNAIYWLGTITDRTRKIVVELERNDGELSILFSDNGPGVPEEKSKFIFDPYYTTRPDGAGLGLTIVGELVTEYNGEFYLVENGPLDGATFKITFRKRI